MPKYEDIRVVLENVRENADSSDLIGDDTPIIIPVFNTPTHLKSMIDQLEDRGWTNIIICDNNSTYPPMIDLLDQLSDKYHVVLWGENKGPRYYTENKDICSRMPKYFIVTDPDILFNPKMPSRSIAKMKRILDMYEVSKVGLAIDIHSPEERDRMFDPQQVDLWEKVFWTRKVDRYVERDELYAAAIDTTFSLYNRDKFLSEIDDVPGKMTCNTSALRVAGRFTCQHMGWWANRGLTDEECEFYKTTTHTWSSTENEKKKLGY
jgi:glycosyltransferase involved in cell wall biosynthesis